MVLTTYFSMHVRNLSKVLYFLCLWCLLTIVSPNSHTGLVWRFYSCVATAGCRCSSERTVCTVICRTVLYHTVQYCTIQYRTVPYSTVQYYTIQYCCWYASIVCIFINPDGRTDGRTDRDCSRGPSGPKKRTN